MQILKQMTIVLAAVLLSAAGSWGQGIGVHYSPNYFPDADEIDLAEEYNSEDNSSDNYTTDEEAPYQEYDDDQPALLTRTVVHYQPVWIVAFRPWWLTYNFYPYHHRPHRIYFSFYDWIYGWHGRWTFAWGWNWAWRWDPLIGWGSRWHWAHRYDPWHSFFRPSHRWFRPWHPDRYAWHHWFQPHQPNRPGHDFRHQDWPSKDRPRDKYLTDRSNERRRDQFRTLPAPRQEQRIQPHRTQRADSRGPMDQTRLRDNRQPQRGRDPYQVKKQEMVRRPAERRMAPRSEMRKPADPSPSTRSEPSRRQEPKWSDRQNRRSEAAAGLKRQEDKRQQERINRTAPSRREQKQQVAYTPRPDSRSNVSRNQAVDRRSQQERAQAPRRDGSSHRRR